MGAVLVTVFMVKILPVAVAVFPLPVVVEIPIYALLVSHRSSLYLD